MPKKIEIYGAGCKTCKSVYYFAKQAISELSLKVEIVYYDDVKTMFEKGMVHAPSFVIDGVLVSSGTLLNLDEIKSLLQNS